MTNKRTPENLIAPSKKVMKTLDKQSVAHDAGTSYPVIVEQNVNMKGQDSTKKKHDLTSKKAYGGLTLLTSKHLIIIEGKEKVKEDLNLLALKNLNCS